MSQVFGLSDVRTLSQRNTEYRSAMRWLELPGRKIPVKVDSGGPILAAENDGLIYLAGVTSWGCAYNPTPGVYTRVPAYARATDDVIKGRSTKLEGVPDARGTAFLGDSVEQAGGGGGVFNGGWWVLLAMLRRHLRMGNSGNHG